MVVSVDSARDILELVKRRKRAVEFGFELLSRMVVKPLDEDALKQCQGVIDLAEFFRDSFKKLENEEQCLLQPAHREQLEEQRAERESKIKLAIPSRTGS